MNWLARMFTIPRAQRETLAKLPGAHLLAQAVQAEAVAVAQHIVDQHVSDPALAEKIKAGIEAGVQHAIPLPPAPTNPMEQLVEGLISGSLSLPPVASINPPTAHPAFPTAGAPE